MRWTLAAIAAVAASAACGGPQSSGSYPRTALELVVPFQPGGGSDVLARTIHAIATRDRMLPVALNIVNKPGGAGAVGLAHVAARRGDPHTLMTLIDTVVSVPLQPDYQGPTWRDLTVVAILALDDMLIVVPAASPFKTIDDLIAHAKAHPGKLKLATNAAGGEDHIYGGLIEAATGAKFTYVHTRGGAEAMQHVVGGHVDVVVPNPSETLSQLEGRLVRALAVGAPERLAILSEVPTLKERGIDVEYRMFRGIGLPGEVAAEAVTYWQALLERVVATPAWKRDYIDKLAITPHLKKGDDAARFLGDVEQLYRKTLRQLGVIES